MTILYGIKNCDTVKKARQWLDKHEVVYRFHDFRTDGLAEPELALWLRDLGAETLVNKRSTTWKNLSEQDKQRALSSGATAIILANPTLIKRPLLRVGEQLHSGFTPAGYARIFT